MTPQEELAKLEAELELDKLEGEVTTPAISQKQANSRLVQGVKDFATETVPRVGADAFKKLIQFGMLPVEGVRAFADKVSGDPVKFGEMTQALTDPIDAVVLPATTPGERSGVDIAGSTLSGAVFPGSRLRNAITGGVSEAGTQVGEAVGHSVGGDNGGVIGGIAGGVVTGGLASIPKGEGTAHQMLAEAIKGLTPGEIAAARNLQSKAQKEGIYLSPEQLFGQSSALDTLANDVLRSGKGEFQSRVMEQGGQTQQAARTGAQIIGPPVSTADATRDLRLAAEGAIKGDSAISPNIKALYDLQGARVTPAVMDDLDTQLKVLQGEFRGSEGITDRLANLRAALLKARDQVPGPPAPPKLVKGEGAAKWLLQAQEAKPVPAGAEAKYLDQIVKETEAALRDIKLNTPGAARQQTGVVSGAVGKVEAILDAVNPMRKQADELFASAKGREAALKSSLAGRLAGKAGVSEEAPDSLGLLRSVLAKDTDQGVEISELSSVLRDRAKNLRAEAQRIGLRDPITAQELMDEAAQAERALPQAARVLWDEAFSNATDTRKGGGRVAATAAGDFASALIGSPIKEENFRKLMQAVGASTQSGAQDPKAYADGVINLLKVLEASARNRQGVPMAANDISKMSGATLAGDAFRVTQPLAQTQVISRAIKNIAYARQYKKLSEIFSDPNSAAIIEKMGRTPVISSKQGALLTTLMTSLNSAYPDQKPKE